MQGAVCAYKTEATAYHCVPQKRYGISLKLRCHFPGLEARNIYQISLELALCFSDYYIFHIQLIINIKEEQVLGNSMIQK